MREVVRPCQSANDGLEFDGNAEIFSPVKPGAVQLRIKEERVGGMGWHRGGFASNGRNRFRRGRCIKGSTVIASVTNDKCPLKKNSLDYQRRHRKRDNPDRVYLHLNARNSICIKGFDEPMLTFVLLSSQAHPFADEVAERASIALTFVRELRQDTLRQSFQRPNGKITHLERFTQVAH